MTETYFSRKSDQAIEILNEVVPNSDPEVKFEYLWNVLSSEQAQGKAVKEVLEQELKAKRWMDKKLADLGRVDSPKSDQSETGEN